MFSHDVSLSFSYCETFLDSPSFLYLCPYLLSGDYAWHPSGPSIYTCSLKYLHGNMSLLLPFIHLYNQLTIWIMDRYFRLWVLTPYYYIYLVAQIFPVLPNGSPLIWLMRSLTHPVIVCVCGGGAHTHTHLHVCGGCALMCLCLFWRILHFLTLQCTLCSSCVIPD